MPPKKDCPENETSDHVESVLTAIEKFTLEVKDTKTHHKNIYKIAFQDPKKKLYVRGIKKCNKIIEFVKASADFEWFYREEDEVGIVRCKSCFHLFLQGKPRLASMTPFEIYHFVNSDTFSSGIFYTKDKTRSVLTGGNSAWYHVKSAMIEHICLIGKGSLKHQEAQSIYEKLQAERKKKEPSLEMYFALQLLHLS